MSGAFHRVGVVLDRRLGREIFVLAKRFHVWLVESPINTPAAHELWREDLPLEKEDYLATGVTLFEADEAKPLDSTLLSIIDTIDKHHGAAAHEPPWSELVVVGAEPTPAVLRGLSLFNCDHVKRTATGFVCRRAPSLGEES